MKYYFEDIPDVIKETGSDIKGLSSSSASDRLDMHGGNKLQEGHKKPPILKFFEQLKDPMIIILIAAAILSGSFGEIADMCIILIVVILNSILGVVQESKAEKAIEALKKMSAPYSKLA